MGQCLGAGALEPASPGTGPGPATHWRWLLRQVTQPFRASVSISKVGMILRLSTPAEKS